MAFINNLIIRPSCQKCKAKGGRSGADLSLADFWSIGMVMPDIDDDKGVTLVMVHSPKAIQLFDTIGVKKYKVEGWEIWDFCSIYYSSLRHHPKRSIFFRDLESRHIRLSEILDQYSTLTFQFKLIRLIDRIKIRIYRKLGLRFK